jgi:hypothetical protein
MELCRDKRGWRGRPKVSNENHNELVNTGVPLVSIGSSVTNVSNLTIGNENNKRLYSEIAFCSYRSLTVKN